MRFLWADLRCINRLVLNTLLERATEQARGLDIFHLVNEFRTTLCLDPRDKMYALLAIEGRITTKKPMKVDYRRSLPQLVIDLYESQYVYREPSKATGAYVPGILGISRTTKPPRIPEAREVIESLALNDEECQEISQLAEQRRESGGDAYRKRWQRVEQEMLAAMETVAYARNFGQRLWDPDVVNTDITRIRKPFYWGEW